MNDVMDNPEMLEIVANAFMQLSIAFVQNWLLHLIVLVIIMAVIYKLILGDKSRGW